MSLSSSRPHTPIRRISRGSIGASPGGTSGISASSLPPSLAHLDQALGLLGDETITLEANLAAWQSVGESLSVFGESFASFLYGMRMNAFTVDWAERPSEDSSESLRLRKELSISASAQPQTSSSTGTSTGPLRGSVGSGFLASNVQPSSSSNADTTYATADESAVADTSFPLPPSPAMVAKSGVPSVPSGSAKSASGSRVPPASGATKTAPAHTIKSALKKPAASTKPKLSPAERKAREVC